MNQERFEAVLDVITSRPLTWDQEAWCGTARCFAGHTVALFGEGRLRDLVRKDYHSDLDANERLQVSGEVPDVAQKLLGLSFDECEWLFDPDRTLEDFQSIANEGGFAHVDLGVTEDDE